MIRFKLIAGLAIAVTCAVSGCTGSSDYKPVEMVKKASPLSSNDHDHGHAEKGPHGGGLIELGNEEYHGEILIDHDSHTIALYVLGKDAKTAVLVTTPEVKITPEGQSEIVLKAAPQPGESDGKASKFELVSDEVVHTLLDAGFLHGELRITIADQPFIGHIDYHLDGSDHDHAHEEMKK